MSERRRARARQFIAPNARAGNGHGYLPHVEALCPEPCTREALLHWTSTLDRPLFVYFIQADDGGPVKIGQAHDPLARLSELQCGNPRRLVIRALVLAAHDTEKLIHRQWMPTAGIRGEWFGRGFEDALVALGIEACNQQLDSLMAPHHVAELIPATVVALPQAQATAA